MGKCMYCGEKAGIFSKAHIECKEKHLQGKQKIKDSIINSLTGGSNISELYNSLQKISNDTWIDSDELASLIKRGWDDTVEKALEDNVMSISEEDILGRLIEELHFNRELLNDDEHFRMIFKGKVLRDINNGIIPDYLNFEGTPFNLMKSETLLWVFQGVPYYEMKTKRHYEGGSAGVSFRVAKGVYLRSSTFKGHPVETTEMTLVDNGILGITDKNIYFSGQSKGFRIKYEKIISFTPYEDGIGIQRDAQTAKPQIFKTNDGWFTNNLIQSASNI